MSVRALAIFQENLHDNDLFEAYRKDVLATLVSFEGKFLVRGGRHTVLEGTWPYARTVVIEFPSRAKAEDWYNSPAYQKIPLRLKSMSCNAVIVDAIE